MVSDHLHHVVFSTRFFIRPVNRSSFYTVSVQECSRSGSSINLISLGKQHTARIQQIYFRLHSTGREHHRLFRNLESCSDHCVQQCFREIVADTTYFTGRRHIHAQNRVSLVKTGERELRSFHTDPIDVERSLVRLAVRSIQHDAGSCFDKVTFQHLRYEREATGSTQVTFNYLHLVVAGKELDVERTGDIQFFSNLTADLLDAAGSCKVNLLCWEYQCSVTGVYTGKFYVLGNSVFNHFTVLSYRVELNFLCIFEELRNNYRIFFRYFGSHLQEVFQFFVIVANVHSRTREYVRRTNQYRITYFFYKSLHFFKAGQFHPSRLVDAKLVEHCRELVTVFGTVDGNRRSTQYRN